MSSTQVNAAQVVVNVPGGMIVEQTGGGCESYVAYLPLGRVLVVSDGNGGRDLYADGVMAQVYGSVEDWTDGGWTVAERDVSLGRVLQQVTVDPLTARIDAVRTGVSLVKAYA